MRSRKLAFSEKEDKNGRLCICLSTDLTWAVKELLSIGGNLPENESAMLKFRSGCWVITGMTLIFGTASESQMLA